MLIDVLQISYLSSIVIVFLITVSLISIQQGLPKFQRFELALCWVMILSPAVEFLSLLEFEIPWFAIAFIHASPLLLGPLIALYRQEMSNTHVGYWWSCIHAIPFVLFFTYRLIENTEIPLIVGVLYLAQILFYQVNLIKSCWPEQTFQFPKLKAAVALIPHKVLVAFYFVFSFAGAVQMVGYLFNLEQIWLTLHVTNTVVFIYVVLLCRGYINLLLKKLDNLNQSSC
ncbi:hypothetical protein [Pseudoalteromonas luteoviolacea]|uniref:Uncharacterized protein n=1 Tax=Pseudoalteromonas luteoviolacea S4054 TaxID=1129367 RepID=A0A0F6AGH5_9GAMM|nr:hypothetical protein [Pseudoalteromonas luteoviolacea]AOT08109.1 hypothetical protein S4054249_09745 [Pseudoalteromonas luteoviolacea]AOT13026.1 hypothetical protein S40542_09745 [Pseudoalteromonas luteoviolacea]AOT17938.1 hypothetical protein S4054_09740 [Pseudoalteromonas luteoviolacea]KKE84494.1 hypothetical protein N479_08710 [Pseudoalteromonas luteoviolacea S4054]KZN69532.1 hypothetical protein N481_22330 [Pseudoalteromonas luteoviolacea S4047-1]